MAAYDILPTPPLDADDIRDTLNSAGGSVSNYTPEFFTPAANINMWSKHKPVALQASSVQDFDSTKPNYTATWWQGENKDCGITIPEYTSMDAVGNVTNGTLNGWYYTLPSGGQAEPFRLGDFAKYSKLAAPPFDRFSIPERVGQNTTITAQFVMNPVPTDGTSLTLSDFPKLASCYLGVKVYNTESGEQFWNTTTIPLSQMTNYQVSLKIAVNHLGSSWVAFPFLCTKTQLQGASLQAATYYAMPKVSKMSLTIASNVDSLSVTSQYVYGSGGNLPTSMRYKFSYQNFSSGSTTNNKLFLLETDKKPPVITNYNTEYTKTLPDFSVSYGSTYNYPYDYNGQEWESISGALFNSDAINWVSVSIGNSRFYSSAQIIRQTDTPEET